MSSNNKENDEMSSNNKDKDKGEISPYNKENEEDDDWYTKIEQAAKITFHGLMLLAALCVGKEIKKRIKNKNKNKSKNKNTKI